MLDSLYVKNLALIDEEEVTFTEGLNVLSGETGAGKSILIGSVLIALGAKVHKEMIRANAAAEAAELENMEKQLTVFKEQMEKYDDCLQEMRKLNLKNIESAQGVQSLAEKAGEKLDQAVGEVEAASVSRIKETSDISIAGINQTLSESLAKIAEIKESSDNLEQITEKMSGLQEKQQELFQNLEDFLHTDNVKVYRNVQAAMIEELEKQTAELKEGQEKAASSSKVLLPFMIVTMIVSVANLVIMIARALNLF